ncbi:hypoxanthine phosphoribosyltransferase [Lactobacillus rodentium]|uniref:Hypoxanthine phosphoribosyltransferase n=1 Tax=Lactobacillus rodentium TaxID=947835 RepID=A0A2Z6TA64_9LACO|nr:hypoxanthine phosphoribosyltransferase [Lactobacillus rodentium]MCR1894536.1 hypoxanthine phosphoribosyltransferase [Lactobacillus rodentium]GBG04753.1 hypoxanthine phosphoribosyltransferase [Lactobacillus rodentium]
MTKSDNIDQIIDRVLYSQDDIQKMCQKLGQQLTQDYAGKDPIVVGVLKGAVFFLTDLVRQMDVKMQNDFMDVSSYGDGFESSGKVRLDIDVEADVKGRDVLLVEDIVDTGHTLKFMKEHLLKRGAKSVKCCALLNKTERREEDVVVDYYGADVENEFVVGYGLDYLNEYRNLPYIGVLKPEVIQANLNR